VPGEDGSPPERIRIRRIHLEEDAGKSLHDRVPRATAVDLNRTGVPLIEIVTEPDVALPPRREPSSCASKQALEYLEVSDCNMEEGSLRVDANVSIREPGEGLGTKTEVKNMNSFSNVERALVFEIDGSGPYGRGDSVVHETLLWDANRGEARPMRSKEESHDYRYFPDPDLPPLEIPRSGSRRFEEACRRCPGPAPPASRAGVRA
jgi:aspartyl-tRNA(Asn)/glutamyl-tRNA(Gln) amidotransferase subunit B